MKAQLWSAVARPPLSTAALPPLVRAAAVPPQSRAALSHAPEARFNRAGGDANSPGGALPRTGANGRELLRGDVENGGGEVRGFLELVRDRPHPPFIAEKDAVRVENCTPSSPSSWRSVPNIRSIEHPDRSPASSAARSESFPSRHIAGSADRRAVCRPLIEKGIDPREHDSLLSIIECRRHSEDRCWALLESCSMSTRMWWGTFAVGGISWGCWVAGLLVAERSA